MVEGGAGCAALSVAATRLDKPSISNATIFCVGPLSTFLLSNAGHPTSTVPDTVDCCIVSCTQGGGVAQVNGG